MERIEIAACTDHKYVMPFGVMFHSVCRNNETVRFHVVIDETVTEEDKKDLKDAAGGKEVLFYTVDSQAFSLWPLIAHLSSATYYRLLLPRILPEEVEKVLMMDGDIIVRHSLLPLWETDLEGVALAAVPDRAESDIEMYNRLQYPPALGYFNAGVLLMNLKYWRENNVAAQIESFVKDHSDRLLYCDQDILNYLFREKKKRVPVKYNTQSGFLFQLEKADYDYWKYEKEVLEARKDPVVIHYVFDKPWLEGTNPPFKSSFLKYQDETKWKGVVWPKPKRPFMTKLISHSNDAVYRIVTKLGLLKVPAKQPEASPYLDLPDVD